MTESTEKARSILRKMAPDPEAIRLIPEAMARKYSVIPVSREGNNLRVAMANPSDIIALEALASISQMRIEPEPASLEEVSEAIDFNYKDYARIEKQISSISSGKRKGLPYHRDRYPDGSPRGAGPHPHYR